MNGEQMEDTYARGHGRVQLRGKAHVEDEEEEDAAPRGEKGSNMSTPGSVPEKGESGDGHRKGKTKTERRLVITELPYSVNKVSPQQLLSARQTAEAVPVSDVSPFLETGFILERKTVLVWQKQPAVCVANLVGKRSYCRRVPSAGGRPGLLSLQRTRGPSSSSSCWRLL